MVLHVIDNTATRNVFAYRPNGDTLMLFSRLITTSQLGKIFRK